MTWTRFKAPARTALAATLAASLALTPITATPAQAGNEDKVGAIAAASFFALLTAGIIASNVSRAHAPETKPQYSPGPRFTPRPGHDPRHGGWDHPRSDPRKTLPAKCKFTVRYGHDAGTYYRTQCLKRAFSHWAYLPDRCEEHIDIPGPDKRGYDAQCLARYGYTEARSPRSAHH